MGYILKCRSCGYGISSADTKDLIKKQAEIYSSCSKCHSNQLKISEQREKSVEFEDNDDNENDDDDAQQSDLDGF